MNKILKIISPFAIILSVSLILLFRTIPVSKLWNNYSVLYVPTETEDDMVMNSFQQLGIENVVALSQQFLPLNISEDSLEYAMYKVNIDNDENNYINNRNSYFFDKSNKYRIYYVPSEYQHKIGKVVSFLNNNHIPAGVDAKGTYPILFPLIVLIFATLTSFFSRNKILFSSLVFIPVLFVFCNPFFPVALSNLILILCIFFITNIWKRKGAITYIKRFLFIPITFVVCLLCCISTSLWTGLMFVMGMVGVVGCFLTYLWVEEYITNKKSFIPVNIRPAKMVTILSEKSKPVILGSICAVLLLFIVFTLTSSGLFNTISSKVQLPSSGNIESTSLPQLEDYYDWAWNVSTFPYKSLNDNNTDKKQAVHFPKYSNEKGIITVTEQVLNFDNNFKKEIFDNINNLQFNSIEKVMQSEGEDFKGGYNTSSSYHIDLFGIIMIIICYLILLFIYFSIIITRKGAKK